VLEPAAAGILQGSETWAARRERWARGTGGREALARAGPTGSNERAAGFPEDGWGSTRGDGGW